MSLSVFRMNLQNATKGFEFLLNGKEEKSRSSCFFFFVNVLFT